MLRMSSAEIQRQKYLEDLKKFREEALQGASDSNVVDFNSGSEMGKKKVMNNGKSLLDKEFYDAAFTNTFFLSMVAILITVIYVTFILINMK